MSGRGTYVFDALNRLTSAQKPTGERYTLAYDVDSRRTTMQLGNGTTRAYAYDSNSRLTTQIELSGATQLVTIVDSYDAVGNRIGRNLDGVVTTWTYDDLYRLTHQNKTGQVCTYVLDPVGNLEVMWEATANPKTFTFDAADRLVTMVEGTNTTTYTYTGYGALEVTVDSRGTRTTNTYDGQDQLIKVQRGGGGVVGTTSTYTFDGDGMRRTAQEGNVQPTTMVWDGSDYLFLDGPSSDSLVLTLDGEIVACGSKDLLTDPLGTLVREISSGASLSSAFSFAPYGTPLSGTPTIPFRFIAAYGYYFDTNDRDYVRARELDKRLGRWMQTDPLWPDERAFGYANESPISLADASGLQASWIGLIELGTLPPVGPPLGDCSPGAIQTTYRVAKVIRQGIETGECPNFVGDITVGGIRYTGCTCQFSRSEVIYIVADYSCACSGNTTHWKLDGVRRCVGILENWRYRCRRYGVGAPFIHTETIREITGHCRTLYGPGPR